MVDFHIGQPTARTILLRANARPSDIQVRILGNATRFFTLLCRLDDERNELQNLLAKVGSLVNLQNVPSSEIPFWRQEFYETIATVYVLDHEFYGE